VYLDFTPKYVLQPSPDLKLYVATVQHDNFYIKIVIGIEGGKSETLLFIGTRGLAAHDGFPDRFRPLNTFNENQSCDSMLPVKISYTSWGDMNTV
jgi:hypothetical protein